MKPNLCAMFGKEVDEEFKLYGIDGTLKINDMNELMCSYKKYSNGKWTPFVEQLNITAQRDVIDIPWVPKFEMGYYYVDHELVVMQTCNDGFEKDISRIKLGNCFRTEKQAIEKGKPQMKQWKKELGWV